MTLLEEFNKYLKIKIKKINNAKNNVKMRIAKVLNNIKK